MQIFFRRFFSHFRIVHPNGFIFYLLLGLFSGLIFGRYQEIILIKAFNWQSLVGSFVGAATALALFLVSENYHEKKKRQLYLLTLEKNIISAINNLASIDQMLHNFIDKTLEQYLEIIQQATALGAYSGGSLVIPLSTVFTLDGKLLVESTESTYLDNQVMHILSNSQELPLFLRDLERQLANTFSIHIQLASLGVNSKSAQNASLATNLNAFAESVKRDMFKQNIPLYMRTLASTLIPLDFMLRQGFLVWNRKFRNSHDLAPEMKMDAVQSAFKNEINAYIEKTRPLFKSQLLLCGEPIVG